MQISTENKLSMAADFSHSVECNESFSLLLTVAYFGRRILDGSIRGNKFQNAFCYTFQVKKAEKVNKFVLHAIIGRVFAS